jgi:hypothetical protein
MERRHLSLVALILSVWGVAFAASGGGTVQIFADHEDAVLFVEAQGHLFNGEVETETGSGFFINRQGLAVTANHVIFTNPDNYESVSITVRPKSRTDTPPLQAEVVHREVRDDVALLRVKTAVEVPSVTLTPAPPTPNGTRIAIMGFPLTFPLSIVDGLISSKPASNIWQTNASVNGGNSGGPVFDEKTGVVIGMVTSGAVRVRQKDGTERPVQGINFFVPLSSSLIANRESIRLPSGRNLELSEGSPPPPPPPATATRLSKGYTISVVKDDHPVLFAPHRKDYELKFNSEPNFYISEVLGIQEHSANHMSELRSELVGEGAGVVVRFTLTSGPAIDRYRAWLHATVHTIQLRRPRTQ